MTTNKLVAVFLIYILCQFVCLSVDGQLWGNISDDGVLVGIFKTLTNFDVISSPTGAFGAIIGFGKGIWNAFGKIFLWNYNFLSGNMFIVKVVLWAFSAACIISLGQMVWSRRAS